MCCAAPRAAASGKLVRDNGGSYMRNLLGWLETRLAQNTFNYLNIT